MKPANGAVQARGAPLAMMALLLAAWIGARVVVWESPFPASAALLPAALMPFAGAEPPTIRQASLPVAQDEDTDFAAKLAVSTAPARLARSDSALMLLGSGLSVGMDPGFAAGHQLLWRKGMGTSLAPTPRLSAFAGEAGGNNPPFLPPGPALTGAPRAGRWSLDAWGFWRQGSDAAPISQGRVPIYGASQVGAVLQFRLAPANARDPTLYARAYRALVQRGESELALGTSARPLAHVPVRVFGEVRVTDGAFRNQVRPSAFAVTEFAPLTLPLGTRLETYAQAGWVGGVDDTFFADGQASVTREIDAIANAADNAVRLSVGAGAWGGAQEGAHRVDLGPTIRLDMTLGELPARLSVDWRERVGGDAGPGSGVAVTLSTRF
ncbi:hypothetical protein J3454_13985 [Erythrobacter sp. NFXS35]|uniref:hypothetical protein n=1 Tax=Erythrobacter sp. NFXS35 TaxID=2818436 RepID=UPI0032E05033